MTITDLDTVRAARGCLPADDVCYRAVAGRDPRFDGWIYVGVTSTGIYCRPSCPAKTPMQRNCRFFAAAGAAQLAGFRACRRCRPDTAPGSPQWNPRADVVARAMRLIADGLVDRSGVSGLAAAVGYSERQLNRLLIAEIGAGPLAIARAQRAQTARVLIENTELRMADVAFAAGFASVRQFNDTVREVYGCPPSQLRHRSRVRSAAGAASAITLRLPVRAPFAGRPLFTFLTSRAISGVECGWTESATGVERLHYLRSCQLPHGTGLIELIMTDDPRSADAGGGLTAVLRLDDLRDLSAAVSRIRRLLDLDADPVTIDAVLGADPDLGRRVAAQPGLRVPGVISGAELAVRALIGQQVSVAGAATTTAGLVRRFGRPLTDAADHHDTDVHRDDPDPRHRSGDRTGDPNRDRTEEVTVLRADRRPADPSYLFPTPATLAEADPDDLPMPRSRGRTLVALATALAEGRIDLSAGADRAEARARLLELPGIGPWTAGYIAMRGLGDPDVLLGEDLVIRRELQRIGLDPHGRSAWAPWRSYATMRLWQASGPAVSPAVPSAASSAAPQHRIHDLIHDSEKAPA